MPFLVTTKRAGHDLDDAFSQGGTGILRVCACGMQSDMAEYGGECPYAVTKRAVATLDDARFEAKHVLRTRLHTFVHGGLKRHLASITALSESGGTVGPLPDGSLITVEAMPLGLAVEWMLDRAIITEAERRDLSSTELVDRYCAVLNAVQEGTDA